MLPTWLLFLNGVVKIKTAYTRYVVDFIADLRGMTTEELAAATTANAERIFGLDSK